MQIVVGGKLREPISFEGKKIRFAKIEKGYGKLIKRCLKHDIKIEKVTDRGSIYR